MVYTPDAIVPISIMARAVRCRGLCPRPPCFGDREDELDLGRSRAPPRRGDLEPPLRCGLWDCLALLLPLPRPFPLVLFDGVSLRFLVGDSTLDADLFTLMCLYAQLEPLLHFPVLIIVLHGAVWYLLQLLPCLQIP